MLAVKRAVIIQLCQAVAALGVGRNFQVPAVLPKLIHLGTRRLADVQDRWHVESC